MKFIAKYTWSNVCANKLRAFLLIGCIAFASVLFFVSLAFPMYLKNYHEGTMRSYFGNSDIYMQANDSTIASMDELPDGMKDNFEYAFGFLALPLSRYSSVTKETEPITYISGSFEDVQVFNPVRILEGTAEDFTGKKAIITKSAAKKFGWSVGDPIRVVAYGSQETFRVVAMVANEGLLSENNETNGPIILLSKEGVYGTLKNVVGGNPTDEELDKLFNMAVFKLKDGVNIPGVASELANLYPTYEVSETVNNEVLNEAVSYLRTPFVACIYLVCAFCALIIYLTCKLTFSERVRQFAVLKAMGATTGSLFGSLLLESAIYGFIGGAFSVGLAALQVYVLPILAPQMTYIVPVPATYYIGAVLFGVGIAVASSFIQAFKSARKSIKQTLLHREKFTKQKTWVSIAATAAFVVFGVAMVATYNIPYKVISIPLFLLALFGLMVALPFIMTGAFWLFRKIIPKRSFEALYLKSTLPSKNLSVANRLLFFGMFLVFLLSTLISSLVNLAKVGQRFNYDIMISQATASSVSEKNIEEIKAVEGVDHLWKGVFLENVLIAENNKYIDYLYGLSKEDIAYNYKDDISVEKIENLQSGQILLNKYFRDAEGFKNGDTFTVNVGVKTVQTLEFEVVGFLDNYEKWGDTAVCLLEDLQGVERIDGFNSIFIQTKAGYDTDKVIGNIRKLSFIGQDESIEGGQEATAQFLTFSNIENQQKIFLNQIQVPFAILRVYSVLVLILSLLCIFIGYVLYLRESSEYHQTLFALGLSPNRFQVLITKQSIFMTVMSIICATVMSALLYLNFENIFNALGTSFTTRIDYFEYSMYALGMLVGTTLMALALGSYFKHDLRRSDKRLFG